MFSTFFVRWVRMPSIASRHRKPCQGNTRRTNNSTTCRRHTYVCTPIPHTAPIDHRCILNVWKCVKKQYHTEYPVSVCLSVCLLLMVLYLLGSHSSSAGHRWGCVRHECATHLQQTQTHKHTERRREGEGEGEKERRREGEKRGQTDRQTRNSVSIWTLTQHIPCTCTTTCPTHISTRQPASQPDRHRQTDTQTHR